MLHHLIVLMICAGCSTKEQPVTYQPQFACNKILAAMPTGWSVISESHDQRLYTPEYFTHPKTKAFILLGPTSLPIDWIDKQGLPHQEFLSKECIYIWIMPSDFTPSFPSLWSDHPPLPEKISSSRDILVYGFSLSHIADTNRWNIILDHAKQFPGSTNHLSWLTWQKDISLSLKKESD